MIRDEQFRISKRPYAVDLLSLKVGPENGPATIKAAWFRRRSGITVACVGELWDYQRPRPRTAHEFLQRHTDGRYGGTCRGRWDGSGYWGAEEPETIEHHLALLRPMLANYPAVPDGFDGWWRF